MMDIVLIVLSASLLFVSFGLPAIWRRATARRRSFEAHADVFFQKLKALAADDETPDELLRGFSSMNALLTSRHGGLVLLHAFLRPVPTDSSAPVPTDSSAKADFDSVLAPFFDRRPELARAFAEGVRAWMQAVLCGAKGPFGILARLLFKNSLPLMDPTRVARRVSEQKSKRHDHHNGHAQAAA